MYCDLFNMYQLNSDIFNHEKPPLQSQQFTSLSTQMRKKHVFYKKAFASFADFARIVEEAIVLGRKRSSRGLTPTDTSKDDDIDDETGDNISIHTSNGDRYEN